jgi:hypothetical protein
MPNYRNAKELMAEMYPVKMAAGGIIGNIGILQAAAMRPSNPLTPEQRNYLDQFKAYEDQYNTQFMPAYEAFRPQYDEWMSGFNQAAEGINKGQFDLRLDATKSGEKTQLERLKAQGWQVVNQGSRHQTIRPTQVQQVYTVPEPRMSMEAPSAPAFPTGVSPNITPEQQKYLDDYAAFQQRYTQEYLPAYEQYAPAMAEWEAQYAKALADMNAGAFNKRFKQDSKSGTAEMQRLAREGWTVTASSNHWNVSPTSVSQVFKQAAPTLSVQRPEEPGALAGYKSAEDVQRAIAEQVERDILAKQRSQRGGKTGLNVFANPAQFNLAGFAGSSTFNEPEAREFFAKGGEVDKFIAKNRK